MIEENYSILEDLVTYQFFFYLVKAVKFFPDWEIKSEIILIIQQLFQKAFSKITNFLSSGGFFLLPALIDHTLIKVQDCLPLIAINFIIHILEINNKKAEDYQKLASMLISNQILKRLNIVLLELFQDDGFVLIENQLLIFEKILDLLIKLSKIDKIQKICCDSILITIINLGNTFIEANQLLQRVPKILEVFENLMQNTLSLNVKCYFITLCYRNLKI